MRISDWSSDVCSSDLWVGHSGIRRSERIATGQDRHSRESGNDSIGVATDRSSQSLPAAPHPVQCGSAANLPGLLAHWIVTTPFRPMQKTPYPQTGKATCMERRGKNV